MEDFEAVHYQRGESHGIPHRCLVPKNVRNVIVAGRSISCEHVVQGSIRVMLVCLAMGEAAGYAAAIAARDNKAFKDIDIKQVRRCLVENGAYIM